MPLRGYSVFGHRGLRSMTVGAPRSRFTPTATRLAMVGLDSANLERPDEDDDDALAPIEKKTARCTTATFYAAAIAAIGWGKSCLARRAPEQRGPFHR
eukprot:1788871-Pyramimonas_sp.AAC.1